MRRPRPWLSSTSQRSVEAAARLNQIKADLGLNTAPAPEAITEGEIVDDSDTA
jgi:hypothetical protein